MTIPNSTNYPEQLDSDANLYLVRDALRMILAEDYQPGNATITVTGDPLVMEKFPMSGIITLTEQCSDVSLRAISFFYGSRTKTTFDELEIITDFNCVKPKDSTHVTLNVIAQHHNNLKDAMIAVEEFMGIKGKVDKTPFGKTLAGRLGFLMKLVYTPKAWFRIIGNTIGLTPLSVRLKEECFRLGVGDVLFVWNFGGMSNISSISTETISIIDPTISEIIVPTGVNILSVFDHIESAETYIKKIYIKEFDTSGKFDVSLFVVNQYGEGSIEFKKAINPRREAPEPAVITLYPNSTQYLSVEPIPEDGPYIITPTLRTRINTIVNMGIKPGAIPESNPSRSYAGELLNSENTPYDPITKYTWSLGDDLNHTNANIAKAQYSMGGLYDLKVRTTTAFGAFRITQYEEAIDVVEDRNLWLWTTDGDSIHSNEMGLFSESFKILSQSIAINRDDTFLDDSNNALQAKREFARNVNFATKTSSQSGERGLSQLHYATGGASPIANQGINVIEYEGFSEQYYEFPSTITRYWNWLALSSETKTYIIFGSSPTNLIAPNTNPSNQTKGVFTKQDNEYDDSYTFKFSDYENGADELMRHVTGNYTAGVPDNGYFAVYRGCWKDGSGYFARNDNVLAFFRIKSFYRTEGVIGNEFGIIKKLPDISGPTKLEGQLVPLTNGVFFFNNSGNISAYNNLTGTWETGGPALSSLAFRSVQDTSQTGFDNLGQTLLVASDGDRTAYLSFDYSTLATIKFNGQDLTFSTIGRRPIGEQFAMGVY